MIVTNLADAAHQIPDTPATRKALEWLRAAAENVPADGRIAIDGDSIYAIVQSYASRAVVEPVRFEAHRRYVDIQYVVSGHELVGWSHLSSLVQTEAYNEKKDVLFGTVPAGDRAFVRLAAGFAMVLWPEDAHAPSLAEGPSAPVKKIVVKVAV